MSVHVTDHAVARYRERIAPVTAADARRVLQAAERACELAAGFGAHTVRLGNGAKLVLRGVGKIRIVTVLPRNWINSMDQPRRIDACGRLAGSDSDHGAICCGTCGLRRGHPIARACTRTDCSLARFAEGAGK